VNFVRQNTTLTAGLTVKHISCKLENAIIGENVDFNIRHRLTIYYNSSIVKHNSGVLRAGKEHSKKRFNPSPNIPHANDERIKPTIAFAPIIFATDVNQV
jgi:hypothetical protein